MWRDAESEDDQRDIFQACGLRWSALLDLPYWNLVLYPVIKSMHALDLGLFSNHCHGLFRIDVNVAGRDGFTEPPPIASKRVKDRTSLRKCLELVYANGSSMLYKLLGFHCKVLYTICIDNNIRGRENMIVVGTK